MCARVLSLAGPRMVCENEFGDGQLRGGGSFYFAEARSGAKQLPRHTTAHHVEVRKQMLVPNH